MMYCSKCNTATADAKGTNCPVCGSVLLDCHPFDFWKGTDFSYIRYKDIHTHVDLTETGLEITRSKTLFYVIKRPPVKTFIPYEDIYDAEVCRSWDFWDLSFAALITLITRMQHWTWFLLVLLFLWSAAGRVISIHYKAGAVWQIPISALRKAPEADRFIAELKCRTPRGVQ